MEPAFIYSRGAFVKSPVSDQLELDGVGEVVAEGTYYESNDYVVYKRRQGLRPPSTMAAAGAVESRVRRRAGAPACANGFPHCGNSRTAETILQSKDRML